MSIPPPNRPRLKDTSSFDAANAALNAATSAALERGSQPHKDYRPLHKVHRQFEAALGFPIRLNLAMQLAQAELRYELLLREEAASKARIAARKKAAAPRPTV